MRKSEVQMSINQQQQLNITAGAVSIPKRQSDYSRIITPLEYEVWMPLIFEIVFFLRFQIEDLEHLSKIVESRAIIFITNQKRHH